MYCPNCGESQESERPTACPECGLPLTGVVTLLDANKGALAKRAEMSRETRDRLIAGGLFSLLMLVPVAIGVKNVLQEKA